MKNVLKQIVEKDSKREQAEAEATEVGIANFATTNDRRNFLKKVALGGVSLAGMIHLSIEDTIAMTTQKVSRASSPSELKITDLRTAKTAVMGGTTIT